MNNGMEELERYLGELFDRYSGRDLRDRVWRMNERMENGERMSNRQEKFADFYREVFNECGIMTPSDFCAIRRFIGDARAEVLYIDRMMGTEPVHIAAIRDILTEGYEVRAGEPTSVNVSRLPEKAMFISQLGNSVNSTPYLDEMNKEEGLWLDCIAVYKPKAQR